MSLFLAAAAGFLKGKADIAQQKREEERTVREEERLLERQQKLYKFQYDMQRRTKFDEEAAELAKKVKALVKTAGIDEGTAINVVQYGAYDDVFNGAVEGTLNPVAVQSMFGNSEDTAPTEMPDPSSYRTDGGIFKPKAAEGRTASQTVSDFNTFDRAMTSTLASVLPQGTFEIRTTENGTQLFGSDRATNIAKSAIVTEAFKAYARLVNEENIDPTVALARVQTFILNSGQEVTDFTNYDQLVAKLYQPLRTLTFDDMMPRYFTPTAPTPSSVEEQGPAGVVPSGGWQSGINFN